MSVNKYVEKKQYLLTTPTTPVITNPATQKIALNPTTINPIFAQSNFLYRTNTNQYLTDYYHSFLTSPTRQLDSILATYFRGNIYAHNKLSVQITKLYADYSNRQHPLAVISLNFMLTSQKNDKERILLNQNFDAAIPLTAKNNDSLVNAWDKGLESIISSAIPRLNQVVKK